MGSTPTFAAMYFNYKSILTVLFLWVIFMSGIIYSLYEETPPELTTEAPVINWEDSTIHYQLKLEMEQLTTTILNDSIMTLNKEFKDWNHGTTMLMDAMNNVFDHASSMKEVQSMLYQMSAHLTDEFYLNCNYKGYEFIVYHNRIAVPPNSKLSVSSAEQVKPHNVVKSLDVKAKLD